MARTKEEAMKYKFQASVVVEATSEEDALGQIAAHVSRIGRHLGNERKLAATGAKFSLARVDDKTEHVDLRSDQVVAEHGPYPLNLDPKSIAHAKQRQADGGTQ
jgi:hypothetical protein